MVPSIPRFVTKLKQAPDLRNRYGRCYFTALSTGGSRPNGTMLQQSSWILLHCDMANPGNKWRYANAIAKIQPERHQLLTSYGPYGPGE